MSQANTTNTTSTTTTNNDNTNKSTKLFKRRMQMVEDLSLSLKIPNIDYIITKLVINDWPENFYEAKQSVKYDNFCYFYALGYCRHTNEYCSKSKRNHLDSFCVLSLYNNGNCTIQNKRKSFYLAYYLSQYCGFSNYTAIIKFLDIIKKDADYNRLQLTYDEKWSNKISNNAQSRLNYSHYSQTRNKIKRESGGSIKSNRQIIQSNPSDTMSSSASTTMSTISTMSTIESGPLNTDGNDWPALE